MKTITFLTVLMLFLFKVSAQQLIEVGERTAIVKITKYKTITRQTNDVFWGLVPTDSVPGFPKDRKFKPLVKSADPFFTVVTLSSDENIAIVLPGGFVVRLQKGVLQNSYGDVVTGSFELYFRDLTQVWNLALSGVPMHYDSGKVSGNFETAGMFELYASQNGDPLSVRQGEQLVVDVASPNGSAGFNQYSFNETNGRWEFTRNLPESSLPSFIPDSIPIYSMAFKLYPLLPSFLDTLSFSNRFWSDDYLRGNYIPNLDSILLKHGDLRQLNISSFKMRLAKGPKGGKGIYFTLPAAVKKGASYNINKLPELNCFTEIVWEYKGALDKQDFAKMFVSRKLYVDLKVTFNQSTGLFHFQLRDLDGVKEFDAQALKSGKRLSILSTDECESIINCYTESYNQVSANFDSLHRIPILSNYLKIMEDIRREMRNQELEMTWSEWVEYAKTAIDYYYSQEYLKDRVYVNRTLTLKGFGLTNIDRLHLMKDPIILTAVFSNVLGQKINSALVILINGSDNSCDIVQMNSGSMKTAINRGSKNIYCLSINNKIYLVNASEVRSKLQSSIAGFVLYEVVGDPAEAIRKALDL